MELLSRQQRGRKEAENSMRSSHHSESGLSPQDLAGDLRGRACPRAVGVSAVPRPGLSVPAPGETGAALATARVRPMLGAGAAGIVGCQPQRITDIRPTLHTAQRERLFPHTCVCMHRHLVTCVFNTDVCVCRYVYQMRCTHAEECDTNLPYFIKIEPIDCQMLCYYMFLRNRKSGAPRWLGWLSG